MIPSFFFIFFWLLQLGGFYIWTYTYHLIRSSAAKLEAIEAADEVSKAPNNDLEANQETHLLTGEGQEHGAISVESTKSIDGDTETQAVSACPLQTAGLISLYMQIVNYP